jgi:hypothetical protein
MCRTATLCTRPAQARSLPSVPGPPTDNASGIHDRFWVVFDRLPFFVWTMAGPNPRKEAKEKKTTKHRLPTALLFLFCEAGPRESADTPHPSISASTRQICRVVWPPGWLAGLNELRVTPSHLFAELPGSSYPSPKPGWRGSIDQSRSKRWSGVSTAVRLGSPNFGFWDTCLSIAAVRRGCLACTQHSPDRLPRRWLSILRHLVGWSAQLSCGSAGRNKVHISHTHTHTHTQGICKAHTYARPSPQATQTQQRLACWPRPNFPCLDFFGQGDMAA